MSIEFSREGISQLFSSVDENGKPYDYFVRRIERRETFQTLTGPITEVRTTYVLINEVTGYHGPEMTLSGVESVITARTIVADLLGFKA